MTELSFKGKEFVYNHHLAVPFRPLVPDESKGIGPVALDGNLVGIAAARHPVTGPINGLAPGQLAASFCHRSRTGMPVRGSDRNCGKPYPQ